MKYFILTSCIIFVMIATACGMTCLTCLKRNSDTCDEKPADYKDANTCMVISEYYNVRNDHYHTVYKGGNINLPCDAYLYVSNRHGASLHSFIKCCNGDNCNTDNFEMPPLSDSIKPSGKMCPSCFSDGLQECITDDMCMCKGEEDKCFEYIGRVRDPGGKEAEYTFKGCMSSLACVFGFNAMIGVDELERVHFKCT
ncbi:phospholipase A2 inhibitor LNF1-like [Discoglossus pictus]